MSFAHPQGRFRPSKLQIMPDEASSLEAELSPLLGPALRAAMFHKVAVGRVLSANDACACSLARLTTACC